MAIVWHLCAFGDERDEAVAIIVLSKGVEFEIEARFFVLILSTDASAFEHRYWSIEHYPCVSEMLDIVDTTFGIDVGVVETNSLGLVVVGKRENVAFGRPKSPLDIGPVGMKSVADLLAVVILFLKAITIIATNSEVLG